MSQATGDLPANCGGSASPCLTVLPGQVGSGDEGTAMLEIIYDMAPGANLYFATADPTITNFAQNIRNLRAAGCDIIVDDVFYFVETPFQDGQTSSVLSTTNGGVVTQAVNDVVASGALYFSSAGNEGNKDDNTSGTFEGDFAGVASVPPLPAGSVHNFGPNPYDTIGAPGFAIDLFWSDPLGGSSNDYDLYVLNSIGTIVVASSTNIQNGTQDPFEQVFGGITPGTGLLSSRKPEPATASSTLETCAAHWQSTPREKRTVTRPPQEPTPLRPRRLPAHLVPDILQARFLTHSTRRIL